MGRLKAFSSAILKTWKKILYCMRGANLKPHKWTLNILSVELHVGRISILSPAVNFIEKKNDQEVRRVYSPCQVAQDTE